MCVLDDPARLLASCLPALHDGLAGQCGLQRLAMENQHGGVTTSDQATRIYMFGDQFPLAAAKEQAEKKLAASRLLAKLNPLYPPKESTIMFSLREERHEPFWHIAPPASPQV